MAEVLHHTVLPSATDEDDSLPLLRDILAGDGDVSVASASAAAPLPTAVRTVLADAVAALMAGQAVTIQPQRTVLTTQEAAEILGITRPTLVRLLRSGKIPFTTPGRHRRVELADVLEFQQQLRKRRREVLEEMAEESAGDPDEAVDGFFETR
ncbi:helix-turn-helix domain-containing protein [Nocardia sp. NPDC005366]|uniref:helix-turn-helix domain-containing protein n=1 Tax=Nocardia sp. NPDC005366 TaxID=3156878 RepID=UPI0033BD67D6